MMINEKELRSLVKTKGVEETSTHLLEALDKKDLKPEDFSIRALYENMLCNERGESTGYDILKNLERGVLIQENMATAVSTATTSHLIGQLIYTAILEGYQLPDFVLSNMVGVVNSPKIFNESEKFPRISGLGNGLQQVAEGGEFPKINISEDWINAPVKQQHGAAIYISKQAIMSDRTGQVLEHAKALGEAAGLSRELQLTDALLAVGGASDRYNYNSRGVAYAPWQTSATNEPYYQNSQSSTPLLDQTSIDAAYQLQAAIKDPLTGMPLADPKRWTVLVTPSLKYKAMRIRSSLQVWAQPSGGGFTPISGGESVVDFDVKVSKYLAQKLSDNSIAQTTWFFGDFERALKRIVALDINVQQASPLSGLLFTHDLELAYRVAKIETPCWFQPRLLIKNLA